MRRISSSGTSSSANDQRISELREETKQKVNNLEREIRKLKDNVRYLFHFIYTDEPLAEKAFDIWSKVEENQR